ncbi:MAG TPA: pyridoxamine 5'-phosphate oxidase family protein [Solirubrobacteraceae bacterium]|nr:pyridoxamine 5'-phosphate oxidase family protein [Solirubrobacteraceae bacterium]
MAPDPVVELLDLPPGYGTPEAPLAWDDVRARLVAATRYWLATVRGDGRPHVVPLDGIWLDDEWFFGGSAETVKHRNLTANPMAVVHLGDADHAVIVEGRCEMIVPDARLARRLSERSKAKYGYGPDPASYADAGVWRLRPERVLAWRRFPRDATRFVFGRAKPSRREPDEA